ncbi:class I adenylate-forming enzyme family protein [Actinomadura terrae]|uniref:class I adenylate-forming enzyme family protein n=1 Tax=Actinomadura terrae TaxID=604353 RepID=UPI001FA6C4A1|nr:fatty acid--CoA ligase family protein [Actinomadura terrae]
MPNQNTFPQPLLDVLHESPGSAALEHGDRVVTRGELLELIGRLAEAMLGAGLGPGVGVAVRTALTPEAFAAHVAAHVLGCRVVCVRPGYSAGQLAHVLDTDVAAVLVDASTAGPEAARAGALLSLGPCPGAIDLLASPASGAGVPDVRRRPDDVALLTFTSGSTGNPKGCAVTYRAMTVHWTWQPRIWSPLAAELAKGFERYLLFGTLASMVVLEFLGLCLLGGGVAVIPEDDGRPLFPHALRRYGITGSILTVPRLCAMLDILREDPDAAGGTPRALVVAGSPLPPRRLAEAVERLGPVVYQGYGQTEANLISMLTPADIAAAPSALDSVGRVCAGVEISIRDEAGRELGVGQEGEIFVRTPYQMTGYWGQPEENRDVLRDGMLRTRDLGRLDADGLLRLTGRARDVIIVNAMVVYAGPVERALASHPDVAEAYVAGAPDERTGEAVHAFVVPVAGRSPDRDELAALVRAELGGDAVPRTVTELSAVPVAASGKPDKQALLRLL